MGYFDEMKGKIMKARTYILKTIALSIVLGTASAVLLSACGGGGGGGGQAGVQMKTSSIVPAAGMFGAGTTIQVLDANGILLGSGTTNASGVANVSIPSSYSGPVVLVATGGTYYDEKLKQYISMTGSLRAVFPNANYNTGGVTPLTEIAASFLLNSSNAITIPGVSSATSASAVAVITTTNNAIGTMFGVPDPLQPPAAAASGVPASDTYGAVLAYLSELATGTAGNANALDVTRNLVNDISDGTWDGAASGVPVPTPSAANFAASMVAAATTASSNGVVSGTVTAPVYAPTSGVSAAQLANIGAVDNMLTDATSATGLRDVQTFGLPLAGTGNAAFSSTSANGTVMLATSTGTNSYNYVANHKEWRNGTWVSVAAGSGSSSGYALNTASSVWSVEQGGSLVNNGDGTMVFTLSGANISWNLTNTTETVLDGSPIYGSNPSVPISIGGQVQTFPTGSREYTIAATLNSDLYELNASSWNQVFGANGAVMTAVPASVQFCTQNTVFVPIPAPPPGADNYTVFNFGGDCSLGQQSYATSTPSIGTAYVGASKQTGILLITISGTNTASLGWLNNQIIGIAGAAVLGGAVLTGSYTPAGQVIANWDIKKNKTANDAELAANGMLSQDSTATATNLPVFGTMSPANFTAFQSWLGTASPQTISASWSMPTGTTVDQFTMEFTCTIGGTTVDWFSYGPNSPAMTATTAGYTFYPTMIGAPCGGSGGTPTSAVMHMRYHVNGTGAELSVTQAY